MNAWHYTLPSLALFALVLSACPSPEGCVTGESAACTCTDGRTGAQVCQADRTFAACICGGGLDAGPLDASMTDVSASPDVPALPDAATDAATDAGAAPCIRDLDWLMMVDSSNSMQEEQALLAAEIPELVRALSSGDLDNNGTPEFMPLDSIHLGVITPDLGTAEVVSPSCDAMGDDGILLSRTGGGGSCPAEAASRIFAFVPATDDAAAFSADFTCVARTGIGGCGFEQQLEATLKALSPSAPAAFVSSAYVPPTFHDGTHGHADGANAGFLRAGTMLAITILTDEDDCSATDYDLYSLVPGTPYDGTSLNTRCGVFDAALHPVSRYVDGLLQLRDDPRLLAFGVIAGVPTELVGLDSEASYNTMLADPRMESRPTSDGTRLEPACMNASGTAYPAERLVTAARDLLQAGARTRVGSICASSYRSDLSAMVRAIVEGSTSCP